MSIWLQVLTQDPTRGLTPVLELDDGGHNHTNTHPIHNSIIRITTITITNNNTLYTTPVT